MIINPSQNYLPMAVLSREVFTQWMEALRQIVERPIPPVSAVKFYNILLTKVNEVYIVLM